MKISSVKIYKFSLPLVIPLIINNKSIPNRDGLILEIQSEGFCGYGEISPLEGFSQESLFKSKEQILSLKNFLIETPIPNNIEALNGAFEKWLGKLKLTSSVRFGIEMACLNLKANKKKISIVELLSTNNHQQIPINGLILDSSKNEALKQAQDLIQKGFTALKFKVGRRSIKEDIETVQALDQLITGKALLHLDANQSWSLNDAVTFGNEVGLAAVDYIEEPFKDIKLIPEFFEKTTIPVALDESLAYLKFNDIKSIDGVDVLVLKPSLIGGIEKTWEWINDSKRFGINIVISSIFESALGVLTLANLAGCSFRNNHAGLDKMKCFKANLLKKDFTIQRGKILITQERITTENINFDLLTEI